MAINLSVPPLRELKPRITVIGVGGAGGNAVNNMITGHLEGVDFVVANTDAQALAQALAQRRIQLGVSITHGLGAGARPDVGKAAAEEALEEILDYLQGSNMVFIAAGMGGGTGTGGAPVIARAAREQGIRLLSVRVLPLVVGLLDTVQRRRKLAKARDALESRLRKAAPAEARALIVLAGDGKPREIEKAIADKDALILKQLDALGWTPTSAARLGIDVARLQDAAGRVRELRREQGG